MKKPEEYLKDLFEEPFNLEEGSIDMDFLNIIKQVQDDTVDTIINLIRNDDKTTEGLIKKLKLHTLKTKQL